MEIPKQIKNVIVARHLGFVGLGNLPERMGLGLEWLSRRANGHGRRGCLKTCIGLQGGRGGSEWVREGGQTGMSHACHRIARNQHPLR